MVYDAFQETDDSNLLQDLLSFDLDIFGEGTERTWASINGSKFHETNDNVQCYCISFKWSANHAAMYKFILCWDEGLFASKLLLDVANMT